MIPPEYAAADGDRPFNLRPRGYEISRNTEQLTQVDEAGDGVRVVAQHPEGAFAYLLRQLECLPIIPLIGQLHHLPIQLRDRLIGALYRHLLFLLRFQVTAASA